MNDYLYLIAHAPPVPDWFEFILPNKPELPKINPKELNNWPKREFSEFEIKCAANYLNSYLEEGGVLRRVLNDIKIAHNETDSIEPELNEIRAKYRKDLREWEKESELMKMIEWARVWAQKTLENSQAPSGYPEKKG